MSEQLRFRNHGDVVEPESAFDGGDRDGEIGTAASESGEVGYVGRAQSFAAQKVVEVDLATGRLRR